MYSESPEVHLPEKKCEITGCRLWEFRGRWLFLISEQALTEHVLFSVRKTVEYVYYIKHHTLVLTAVCVLQEHVYEWAQGRGA